MVHRCSMKMDDKNDGWSMWVREGPSVRRVADGGAESFILHISSCEMSSSNVRTDWIVRTMSNRIKFEGIT